MLDDIVDYVRDNIIIGIAAFLVLINLALYFSYTVLQILPVTGLQNDLEVRRAAAQERLQSGSSSQNDSLESLKLELESLPQQVASSGQFLLPLELVDQLVNDLFLHADEAEIAITILEQLGSPAAGGPAENGDLNGELLYEVLPYRLEAIGTTDQLINFVGMIEGAKRPAYLLEEISISQANNQGLLSMRIVMMTSPFGGEDIALAQATPLAKIEATPAPLVTVTPTLAPTRLPTATPSELERLTEDLHVAWGENDWEEAIGLIEAILGLDPNSGEMREKLYSATINHAYATAAAGNAVEARVLFNTALALLPERPEAVVGLASITERPTPTVPSTAEPLIHIVTAGETLFSIGQRYGVTVEEIRAANGIVGSRIEVGQRLVIPNDE